MSQEIAINTGKLDNDITAMQERLNGILKDMEDMYSAVNALDAMWEGPANAAFIQQFANDQENMTELCEIIQDYIECLTFAKDEYVICENEINNIVSSIRI